MKKNIIITIVITAFFFVECNVLFADIQPLKVSDNGRFLTKLNGDPVFLNADTCWKIAWKLKKEDVDFYLNKRKEQKFNAIGVDAFPDEKAPANKYGQYPFDIVKGKFDPLKPIIKKGYDYWDHLEFIIDNAAEKGIYVILLPAWGSRVAGAYGSGKPNGEIIFDKTKAYKYALWISKKFKNKKNIIWMIGGDRSAVYGKNDYRSVFRAMAKGITDGYDKNPVLISYHPQKWAPNSSTWFHNESWLSFNSVQDQPSDQINAITKDWKLKPAKPVWLFEGGYEGRHDGVYKDWQIRFQAYQTVFAGGFGETYGNMAIWDFPENWKKHLDDPGANQLQHLVYLMSLLSKEQYLERVPDQSLLHGDTGKMSGNEGVFSTCIVATRSKKGDVAMIYTSGIKSVITVKMHLLEGPEMFASWFSPRSGKWKILGSETNKMIKYEKNIRSGKKALDYQFWVPGHPDKSEDWVLVLYNKELKGRIK